MMARLSLRVPVELRARLAAFAKRDKRTLSWVAIYVLMHGLQDLEAGMRRVEASRRRGLGSES